MNIKLARAREVKRILELARSTEDAEQLNALYERLHTITAFSVRDTDLHAAELSARCALMSRAKAARAQKYVVNTECRIAVSYLLISVECSRIEREESVCVEHEDIVQTKML